MNHKHSGTTLHVHINSVSEYQFEDVWKSIASPKVEAFLWLAALENLQTREHLGRIGVLDFPASLCSICGEYQETVAHLFLHYQQVLQLWSRFFNWWGCSWVMSRTVDGLFQQWSMHAHGKMHKKMWLLVLDSTFWSIWLLRNAKVFNGKSIDWDDLFSLTLLSVVKWAKFLDKQFAYIGCDLLRSSDGIKKRDSTLNTWEILWYLSYIYTLVHHAFICWYYSTLLFFQSNFLIIGNVQYLFIDARAKESRMQAID